MNITAYAICYNEIYLLPFYIAHYSKFCNRIVIYDNGSTDGSDEYIKQHAEYRYYSSVGESNEVMTELKNSCWKGDTSDYVIVSDIDEFLIGSPIADHLVFATKGYDLIGAPNEPTGGSFGAMCSKCICFSPKIKDIAYDHGCHKCNPIDANGRPIVPSDIGLQLWHYYFISQEYWLNRCHKHQQRANPVDLKIGWGVEKRKSDDELIVHYMDAVRKSKPLAL
jgi:hypothetical protein